MWVYTVYTEESGELLHWVAGFSISDISKEFTIFIFNGIEA